MPSLFIACVASVAKVLAIGGVGAAFAKSSYSGGHTTVKDVGKILSQVLLPCLIIHKLGTSLTWELLSQAWLAALFSALYIVVGLLIGKIVSGFSDEPTVRPILTTAFGISNAVGVPLPLFTSLCTTIPWLIEMPDAIDRGISIIFLYSIPASSFLWSVGYYILGSATTGTIQEIDTKGLSAEMKSKKPLLKSGPSLESLDDGDDVDLNVEDAGVLGSMSKHTVALDDALENGDRAGITYVLDAPNGADDEGGVGLDSGDTVALKPAVSVGAGVTLPVTRAEEEDSTIHLLKAKVLKVLRSIKPPIWGFMIGGTIGLNPALRDLFVGTDAPFHVVFEGLETLGSGMIPMVLLTLGGSLAQTDLTASLPKKTLTQFLVGRLLILPAVLMAIPVITSELGILPDDKLLKLILLIEGCSPSAMNLVVIAQQTGNGEDVTAAIIFWQYVLCVIPITMYMSLAVYYLS
eukprot:GFYU01002539.1.p1 GENE.GFYU01002539.1~~GFYU01002539.1.p1  ORF type:complete len:463 (-),score=69.47 GFYU01002539.1:132-1520(-)